MWFSERNNFQELLLARLCSAIAACLQSLFPYSKFLFLLILFWVWGSLLAIYVCSQDFDFDECGIHNFTNFQVYTRNKQTDKILTFKSVYLTPLKSTNLELLYPELKCQIKTPLAIEEDKCSRPKSSPGIGGKMGGTSKEQKQRGAVVLDYRRI